MATKNNELTDGTNRQKCPKKSEIEMFFYYEYKILGLK